VLTIYSYPHVAPGVGLSVILDLDSKGNDRDS